MLIMKRKTLLSIFLIMLLFSCKNPLDIEIKTPPEDPQETIPEPDIPEYKDLPSNSIEYFLFSEKRRKRSLVADLGQQFSSNNEIDVNDFDGDGFSNAEDPYPFDFSYPGVRFLQDSNHDFRLPLFGYNSSDFNYELNIRNFFGKDPSMGNQYAQTTMKYDRASFNNTGTDVADFFNSLNITTNQNSFNSNNDRQNVTTIGQSSDNSYYDISEENSSAALFNMIKIRGMNGLSYDSNTSENEENIENMVKSMFSFVRLLSHVKDEIKNSDEFVNRIRSIIGLKSEISWENFVDTDKTALTGHANTSITVSEDYFNSNSPLKKIFTDTDGWLSQGYENIFFTTTKPPATYDSDGNKVDYIDNINLVCSDIDNVIQFTSGFTSFDTKAAIGLSDGTGKTLMDYEIDDMYIIKVIVDREYSAYADFFNSGTSSGNSVLSAFLCSKDEYSITMPVSILGRKTFGYSTYEEAGFSINDSSSGNSDVKIEYDINNDYTKFRDIIYRINEDEGSRVNHEYFTYFIYAIPFKWETNSGYSRKEWVVLGHNVHFWPVRERNVVTAILDENNNVLKGPIVLPYEYNVDSDNMFNLYYDDTLFETNELQDDVPLYISRLLDDFDIDYSDNQKLLYMFTKQKVTGDTNHMGIGSDGVKLVGYDNIKMTFESIGKSWIPEDSSNAGNVSLRALYDQLDISGYVIKPDNSSILYGGIGLPKFEIDCEGVAVVNGSDISPPQYLTLSSMKNGDLASIEYDIDMTDCDHWIPNDGGYSDTFSIRFNGIKDNGEKNSFANEIIYLHEPLDPNWDTNDSGLNNLHRNKGTGISLYAVFGNSYERLAEMKIKHDSFEPSEAKPYYIAQHELLKSGNYLKTNSDGTLVYMRFDNNSTSSFVLKADGTVRPGDDFYLRFRYKGLVADYAEDDFFACYDKEMLDIARSYIENGSDTIKSWRNFDTNVLVNDAVAYSWGGYDTVPGFNGKMDTQGDVDSWFDYNMPAFTIVESGEIKYYKPEETTLRIPGFSTYAKYNNSDSQTVFLDAIGNPLNPDSDILDANNRSNNYSDRLDIISAGIDCSGLVCRSANYSGSSYVINDGVKRNTEGLNDSAISWMIDAHNDPVDNGNRNLLVPGDILVQEKSHVVFILDISYGNNSRIVIPENVTVIEAARGSANDWKVIDYRDWNDLIENSYELNAKRLISN